MGQRLQVLLLTNIAAPYRLPLFEDLAYYVDLTVYFCRKSDPTRQWRLNLASERVKYVELPFRAWRLPLGNMELIWNPKLANQLREHRFDVYIAGENLPNFLSVITVQRAARRQGKPFILWSGVIETPYASGHWLSNLYRRWLYSRTDAFVAYGKKAKDFLVRRGVSPDKIYTGTQGIVPGWIWHVTPDKNSLGLDGRVIVLYVGYLVPRKGVATLIRAYQRARRPDSTLVIVGDGPQRADLEAIAQGERDIIFTGYLEGETKWRYFASADLFVLPTYHDPWPQVINEAMYFGLPVITTDRDGSVHEVVHNGENGLVVPAGDVDALAEALASLLNDEERRRRMGERSRLIIADYTVEKACNTFLQAIEHAMGKNSSRPSTSQREEEEK